MLECFEVKKTTFINDAQKRLRDHMEHGNISAILCTLSSLTKCHLKLDKAFRDNPTAG